MYLVWIHLITWIVLLIVTILALFSKSKKTSLIAMMIARVCYLFAIVTGVLLISHAFPNHPLLTIIKVILGLSLIAIIEIAFANKNRMKLTPGLAWLVILFILIVGGFGLYLTSGFPLSLYF
ncbi:YisL family protein [Fructilactobacillus sp. Tb1]|uniref:YisL family protein n=1 Tax=Fructilactobacillus sp. Tb1 TaxID=3422304 RepID=UPI003D2A8E90